MGIFSGVKSFLNDKMSLILLSTLSSANIINTLLN